MICLKKGYLAFGLLFEVVFLLSTDTIRADNSVHIFSKYKQLVTSSTLNWLPLAHYEPSKEIVIGGFEILQETEGGGHSHNNPEPKRRPLFVCRALHNGLWVVGSQKDGEKKCTVSLHRIIESYDRYELLENINNAARISWVQWDKYHPTPVGAVATEKMYVARHKVNNNNHDGQDPHHHRYTHYIGTFNPQDKLGTITYVKDNGLEGIAESGEILAETEPIYYELNSVKLDWHKKRVIKRTPMTLGKTTIVNAGSGSANMAEAFAYSYNYSIYWGQGHAILKGLNTSIMLTNGTTLPNIMWGTKEEKTNTDVYTVTVYLEPGTGVNVSLEANYTDMELPYTGKLVSHYEDGTTKARPIGGIRSEKTMFDVSPVLGPIYFLNNFTVVPTTTVPPTTEPPTTTTTTSAPTTTTTTTIKEITKDINHRPIDSIDQDENMIIPIQKSDTTNMQSDDGGPQSLKDKGETPQSSSTVATILFTESNIVLSSLLHLFCTILIHRIT